MMYNICVKLTRENRIKWKNLFDGSSIGKEISRFDEMSASLKSYRDRIENLRFQLVENWCLCKYCQMFNSQNLNYNHWVKELKIYIDGLKYVNLKNGIDKRKPLKMVLVDYFDLNDENMIFRMIRSKFKREGLFEVEDVKKYNRFCGGLVIGFGIVAEITIFIACAFGGIVTIICTIAIAVEAFIVMKIYNKNEIKMLKKR